jgi:hypothetical protein
MHIGISSQIVKVSRERPKLASASAQLLPSLYIWVTKKFMELMLSMQLVQRFRSLQGTREWFLKAFTTRAESDSNQREVHWCCTAISIALIAPESSAWYALPIPVFSAKQSKNLASLSLNIPPQDEDVLVADPSVLHLIQRKIGGCQTTSIILGAFGGWIQTLNFFKIIKSDIEDEATVLERLLDRETFEMIVEIADLQWIFLSLNLCWFLEYQIALRILIRAAVIVSLHWGFQFLWQIFQMSSILWSWKLIFKMDANHFQILQA